jgi:hypothetical protein
VLCCRTLAYERFDFGDDLGLERARKRVFFSNATASAGRASQIASLTSTDGSQVARNWR